MSRCTDTLIASYVWTFAFLFVKGILPTCNMTVAVSSGKVLGWGIADCLFHYIVCDEYCTFKWVMKNVFSAFRGKGRCEIMSNISLTCYILLVMRTLNKTIFSPICPFYEDCCKAFIRQK
jgi:hypothetical protein